MGKPDYLPDYLTPQQVVAILFQGPPLLIIAGPGSGKTSVMSWRVAHLIRSGTVRPENLLVTTFTNKAALELKDRIQRHVPEINVELMQVSTLHSFCANLLRQYAPLSRFPREFEILDENTQFLFVYAHRKELGLANLLKGRPIDFYNNAVRFFNLATEEMVDPSQLRTWCEEQLAACSEDQRDECEEQKLICEAYTRYLGLLTECGLADFAFLQRCAVELVEMHPEIAQELRERYQHILVDE